jgi:hypothetical protein
MYDGGRHAIPNHLDISAMGHEGEMEEGADVGGNFAGGHQKKGKQEVLADGVRCLMLKQQSLFDKQLFLSKSCFNSVLHPKLRQDVWLSLLYDHDLEDSLVA